ncbi:MAG TPA: DNA polymerase III subunit gamma/tau [Candidatus Moranbacteria bacterium]|nr:DNA polymerase III subunit gamma/tau [Candidatus Moranbacteria bacterium]
MSSLYRAYRPDSFSKVIGQAHIVQTLQNALLSGRIAHAYLFTGPRGTGKTTMARILAKAVNCTGRNEKEADPCGTCQSCTLIAQGKLLDIFEIDAASNTGVDNIRELRETVKLPPTSAKYKVYIIDEVHMLSTGAFNALLKTLEEPPSHVIFILATTEIHKVPETIVSRCQRFDFLRLSIEHILEKLSKIAADEEVKIEREALEMIAIAAEGGMRDAESLLGQVMALEDKNITAQEVERILGTTEFSAVASLAGKILEGETAAALSALDNLAERGYDLDILVKSLLNYLRRVLLLTVSAELEKTFANELTTEQLEKIRLQAKGKDKRTVLDILSAIAAAQGKARSAFIPQLPLEMAIVDATSPKAPLLQKSAPPNVPPIPLPSQSQAGTIPSNTPKQTVSPPKEAKLASFEKEATLPEEDKILAAKSNSAKEVAASTEEISGEPLSFSQVQKIWQDFVRNAVAQNQSLAALFPNCKLAGVEGSTINIAARFSFYKDKLNDNTNRLTLETVFANILGRPVRVKGLSAEEAKVTFASAKGLAEQGEPRETSSLLSDAASLMGGVILE